MFKRTRNTVGILNPDVTGFKWLIVDRVPNGPVFGCLSKSGRKSPVFKRSTVDPRL